LSIKRDLEIHRLFIYGLIGAVSLTVLLFQLSWSEITSIGSDVGVVKEDVAYMKGLMDRYWSIDGNP
jgi:hypothetical protein